MNLLDSKLCPYCKERIMYEAIKCRYCGERLQQNFQNTPNYFNEYPHSNYENYEAAQDSGNGLGLAGFIISLVSVLLGWIPFLGWVIWIVGAAFSVIGVFRKNNGFAIAGIGISFFSLFIIILFIARFNLFKHF